MQVCVENALTVPLKGMRLYPLTCLTTAGLSDILVSLSGAKTNIMFSNTKKENIIEISRRVVAVMRFDLNLKN